MKIDNNIIPILDTKGGLSIDNWKGFDLKLIDIIRIDHNRKLTYIDRLIEKLKMIYHVLFNKKVSVVYTKNKTIHRITANRDSLEQFTIAEIIYSAEIQNKIFNQELINPNFEKWKLN